jgi:cbb3-type cytochrome c oxidase subunit III
VNEYQNMKHPATTATLTVLAACSPFIWGCASRGPVTVEDANYPASNVDARGLFQENCIVCHGKNGRAHTFHGRLVGAQNLTDPKWQSETTDAQIINAINTGPSVMPAFGKKLSESEIEALAAYVRSFRQEP